MASFTNTISSKNPCVRSCFVLFALSVLVYAPSLWNGFVYDDLIHIVNNPRVQSLKAFLQSLGEPTFPGNLYRPVLYASYQIQNSLGLGGSFFFHLGNVLLHGLVGCAAFVLFCPLFGSSRALCAAILFILNPFGVEVVANVSGRAELLAALSVLLFLLLFRHYFRAFLDGTRSVLVFVFPAFILILGFYSKESALVGLPLSLSLFCYEARLKDSVAVQLRSLRVFAPFLVVGGALVSALVFRSSIVGGASEAIPFVDNPLTKLSYSERVLTASALLGRYLVQFFSPLTFSSDYSYDSTELLGLGALTESFHLLLVLFALSFFLWGTFSKRPLLKSLALSLGWYFIAFLVTSNILFPIGTIYGERLAYLPSVGLALFTALIFGACDRYQLFSTFLAASFLLRIVPYQFVWASSDTLLNHQLSVHPKSIRVLVNEAYRQRLQRQYQGAEEILKRAEKIYPEGLAVLGAFGELYSETGDFERATRYFRRALELDEYALSAHFGLGKIYLHQGEYGKAESEFQQVLMLSPSHFEAQVGIVMVLLNTGRRAEALRHFQVLRQWDPAHREIRRLEGFLGVGE